MIFPIRRAVLCAGLALTTALAGCSGSDKKTDGSTPPTSGGTSGSSPSSGGGGSLDAAAKAEITRAFKAFYDTKTPLAKSMAVLQHGATFRKTLIAESNSPSAKGITAKVSAIKSQSANVAAVTFSLFSLGNSLLPDISGYAVREGGKWKVAAQTFCNLLTLENTAPPACKDESITALPD